MKETTKIYELSRFKEKMWNFIFLDNDPFQWTENKEI